MNSRNDILFEFWLPIGHRVIQVLNHREPSKANALSLSLQVLQTRKTIPSPQAILDLAMQMHPCEAMMNFDECLQKCIEEHLLLQFYVGLHIPLCSSTFATWISRFNFKDLNLSEDDFLFEGFLTAHHQKIRQDIWLPLKNIQQFALQQGVPNDLLVGQPLKQAPQFSILRLHLTTKHAELYELTSQGSSDVFLLKLRKDHMDLGEILKTSELQNATLHPNILKVLFIGCEGERTYQIFEKHGESLDKLSGILRTEDVIECFLGLAKALERLHELKIVHGDVKPGNIFYNLNTQSPKLGDFDAAVDLKQSVAPKRLFTKAYASADLKLNGCVSAASDCYAYLLAFFDVLFGKLVQENHRTCGYPDYDHLPKDLNVELTRWLSLHPTCKAHFPHLARLADLLQPCVTPPSIQYILAQMLDLKNVFKPYRRVLASNIGSTKMPNNKGQVIRAHWAKHELEGATLDQWQKTIEKESEYGDIVPWFNRIDQEMCSQVESLLTYTQVWFHNHLSSELHENLHQIYIILGILDGTWPFVIKRNLVMKLLHRDQGLCQPLMAQLLNDLLYGSRNISSCLSHHLPNLANDLRYPIHPMGNTWCFDRQLGAPVSSSFQQFREWYESIYFFMAKANLLIDHSNDFHRHGTILNWIKNDIQAQCSIPWQKGPLDFLVQNNRHTQSLNESDRGFIGQLILRAWQDTRPHLDILRHFIPVRVNPETIILENNLSVERNHHWHEVPSGDYLISTWKASSAEIIPWPFFGESWLDANGKNKQALVL